MIAVRDDDDWRAFCDAIDSPELASDPRFADPLTRHGNQDELDTIISQWTAARSKYEVMELLQNAGVPSGPVLDGRDMLGDPHFRERGYFEPVEHHPKTGLGRREYLTRGWRMSGNDVRIRKPAPMLGEDNAHILSDLLGLTETQLSKLEEAEAIGQTLMPARVSRPRFPWTGKWSWAGRLTTTRELPEPAAGIDRTLF